MVYDPNKDGSYWEYHERRKKMMRKAIADKMAEPILTREEWLAEIKRELGIEEENNG